ncbi:hypothetical protein [Methylocella sp.]|uniref:hypothetical protein n=1 Tax=Methylocella sp. TaxID=1978226 RepID=UPI0037847416
MKTLYLSLAVVAVLTSAGAALAGAPRPSRVCFVPTFQEQVRHLQDWRSLDKPDNYYAEDYASAQCEDARRS